MRTRAHNPDVVYLATGANVPNATSPFESTFDVLPLVLLYRQQIKRDNANC